MSEPGPSESRLAPARQRVTSAKRALALTALAGFAAALVLARLAHPGAAQTSPGSPSTPTASESEQSDNVESDDAFFGDPQIAPAGEGDSSTTQPDARTSVS